MNVGYQLTIIMLAEKETLRVQIQLHYSAVIAALINQRRAEINSKTQSKISDFDSRNLWWCSSGGDKIATMKSNPIWFGDSVDCNYLN